MAQYIVFIVDFHPYMWYYGNVKKYKCFLISPRNKCLKRHRSNAVLFSWRILWKRRYIALDAVAKWLHTMGDPK